jgi:hypothetical protein
MTFASRNKTKARCQRFMLVILATQEAEIRRIVVRSQLWQIVCEPLSWKTLHKNRAGGVARGEGPELKPQNHKKKKKTGWQMSSGDSCWSKSIILGPKDL